MGSTRSGPLLNEVDEVITTFTVDPILLGGVRLTEERQVVPKDSDSHFIFGEERAKQHLAAAQAAGILRPDTDTTELAQLLIALLTGHGTIAARHPAGPTLTERMHRAWQLLLPAITTPEWYSQWTQDEHSVTRSLQTTPPGLTH